MNQYVTLTPVQVAALRGVLKIVFRRRVLDEIQKDRSILSDVGAALNVVDHTEVYRDLDLPLHIAEINVQKRKDTISVVSLLLTVDQIQRYIAVVNIKLDETYISAPNEANLTLLKTLTKHQEEILLSLKTAHEKNWNNTDLKVNQVGAGQA